MAEDTLKIKVDLDSDGVVKGVEKIEESFENLEKSVEESGQSIGDSLSEGIDQANDSLNQLNENTDNTSQNIGTLSDFLEGLAEGFKKTWDAEMEASEEMQDLSKAYQDATQNIKKLSDSIDSSKNSMDDLGKKSKKSSDDLDNLSKSIKVATKALLALDGAATGAAGFIGDMILKLTEYGDSIDKTSQEVGMSTKAYQEWNYVMQLAGSSMNEAKMGFKSMVNAMDDAKNGSDAARAKFSNLGISLTEIREMTPEQMFERVISSLQGMENQTEKAALANDILGRSGQRLMPLLNQTSGEVAKLRKEVHELGGVMSTKQIQASVAFQDSLTRLKTSVRGFAFEISSTVIPSLTKFSEALAKVFATKGSPRSISELKEASKELVSSFKEAVHQLMPIIREILPEITSVLSEVISALTPVIIDLIKELFANIISQIPSMIKELGFIPQLILNIVAAFMVLEGIMKFIKFADDLLIFINLLRKFEIATKLATLAQAAFNFVMSLNPVVLITIAIIALVAALGVLIYYLVEATVGWEAVGNAISNALSSIVEFVKNNWQQLFEFLVSPFTGGFKLLYNNCEQFRNFIDGIVNSIKNTLLGIGQGFQNAFNLAVSGIKSFGSNLQSTAQSILSSFGSLISNISGIIGNGLSLIAGFLTRIKNEAMSLGSSIVNSIKSTVDEMVSAFKNAFNNVVDAFVNMGRNIIDGLINGIKSRFQSLMSTVKNGIEQVKESIQTLFGIHSPSRVMKYYGQMCVAGFEKGLQPMGDVFDETTDNVQASLGNTIASSTGGDFASQGSYTNKNNIKIELVGETAELFRFIVKRNNTIVSSTGTSPIKGGIVTA